MAKKQRGKPKGETVAKKQKGRQRGEGEEREKVQAVELNGRTSDKDECNERVDRTGREGSDRSVDNRVTAKDGRRWTGRGANRRGQKASERSKSKKCRGSLGVLSRRKRDDDGKRVQGAEPARANGKRQTANGKRQTAKRVRGSVGVSLTTVRVG